MIGTEENGIGEKGIPLILKEDSNANVIILILKLIVLTASYLVHVGR